LGTLAIVCLLGLFFFAGSDDKGKQHNDSSLTASNGANSNPNPDSASVTFPALHFASSGRLPIKLHDLRLGMTVAEAMAEDPNLENQHTDSGSGSQPGASDPNAQLVRRSDRTGFFETASFSNGRLTYVTSTVSSISPEDASLFSRNTLVQLGKPDIEIYAGPSANAWIWIDGDVRIRYTNDPVGNPAGARTVALSMVIYPDLIKGLLAERSKPGGDPTRWDADANLELNRHDFGEDTSKVVLKELPDGLPDVHLRMTPSQVRSALPGIELTRMSESGQQGTLEAQNVTTDVALWNGLVSFVGRTWGKVPSGQAITLRRNLMEEFGTPSARVPPVMNQFESITWENEHTKIVYMFSVIASDKSHQVQAFYYDKQLQALSDANQAREHPQEQFKPAPEEHSFF
jgi:hypothetical protein